MITWKTVRFHAQTKLNMEWMNYMQLAEDFVAHEWFASFPWFFCLAVKIFSGLYSYFCQNLAWRLPATAWGLLYRHSCFFLLMSRLTCTKMHSFIVTSKHSYAYSSNGDGKCVCTVDVWFQIKLFVFHPSLQKMVESTLMVHMNATLADATRTAWKVLLLT